MTDDSLLGQLAEEFARRVREGKLPDIEEYACRFPVLAARCLLRAAVASSPFVIPVFILKMADPILLLLYAGGSLLYPQLPLAVTGAALIHSTFRPHRVIAGLIAGTWLVVR